MKKIQFCLTPSAGKRLIAKAIALLPDVTDALKEHTVVVIAGTTNAPVAYELLNIIGDTEGFSAKNFFRGLTVPEHTSTRSEFIGDVVIEKGKWLRGKTIFDMADNLSSDDIIFKGGNAVNIADKEAGVLIGNSKVGTAFPILSAVYGRRSKLYVPIGCEKTVSDKISDIASLVNDRVSEGLRFLPLPGEVITELDAIRIISGARGHLIGGGGVLGAEGCSYFTAEGSDNELDALLDAVKDVKGEPRYSLD